MSETAFFFSLGADRLFAMLHRPCAQAGQGIVLCHAFAEEKLWAHRVYVGFARAMAAEGFAVLRFDFRGEGDSDLDFEQASIAHRVDDTVRALEVLRELEPRIRRSVLLGHRLGCAIAALAAARAPHLAEALIAWDPVPSGRDYLMQLLRSAVASEFAARGKAPTRAGLVKALEEGRSVVVDGYAITPGLYRALCEMRWPALLAAVPCPALVVEGASEPAFWRQSSRLHARAPAMTARSIEWLRSCPA